MAGESMESGSSSPGEATRAAVWLRRLRVLKGTPLHPQWLSDRFHALSRKALKGRDAGWVLDVGSGDSDLSSLLGPGARIIRLDYPDTNARYQIRPDVYGDARALPVADGSMNNVVLLEVIEHIFEYARVIRECRRVLVPGGRLYLSVPFIYPVHDAPNDYHRFTVHGLKAELSQAGFEIEYLNGHGNSVIVALQMMNLSLLELVARALGRQYLLGLVLAIPAYAACLVNNILAMPFLALRFNDAAVFGHFVIARRGS